MPAYDRKCPKCSHEFEVRRSFSDNSPIPCQKCGTESKALFRTVPAMFGRSGRKDSPLDDMPHAEQMRSAAEASVQKTMKDMHDRGTF